MSSAPPHYRRKRSRAAPRRAGSPPPSPPRTHSSGYLRADKRSPLHPYSFLLFLHSRVFSAPTNDGPVFRSPLQDGFGFSRSILAPVTVVSACRVTVLPAVHIPPLFLWPRRPAGLPQLDTRLALKLLCNPNLAAPSGHLQVGLPSLASPLHPRLSLPAAEVAFPQHTLFFPTCGHLAPHIKKFLTLDSRAST